MGESPAVIKEKDKCHPEALARELVIPLPMGIGITQENYFLLQETKSAIIFNPSNKIKNYRSVLTNGKVYV